MRIMSISGNTPLQMKLSMKRACHRDLVAEVNAQLETDPDCVTTLDTCIGTLRDRITRNGTRFQGQIAQNGNFSGPPQAGLPNRAMCLKTNLFRAFELCTIDGLNCSQSSLTSPRAQCTCPPQGTSLEEPFSVPGAFKQSLHPRVPEIEPEFSARGPEDDSDIPLDILVDIDLGTSAHPGALALAGQVIRDSEPDTRTRVTPECGTRVRHPFAGVSRTRVCRYPCMVADVHGYTHTPSTSTPSQLMPHLHPPAIARGAAVVHDAASVMRRSTYQPATSPADDVAVQNPPPRSLSALLSAAGSVTIVAPLSFAAQLRGLRVLPGSFNRDDLKSISIDMDADIKSCIGVIVANSRSSNGSLLGPWWWYRESRLTRSHAYASLRNAARVAGYPQIIQTPALEWTPVRTPYPALPNTRHPGVYVDMLHGVGAGLSHGFSLDVKTGSVRRDGIAESDDDDHVSSGRNDQEPVLELPKRSRSGRTIRPSTWYDRSI
ncbi:hypothetical protein BDZ89DRAFT_1254580 [Hymenopellis radicata]|nr:hypothetical protein BDZ89DRAFT_1254580 [Hymenopellis radicata]